MEFVRKIPKDADHASAYATLPRDAALREVCISTYQHNNLQGRLSILVNHGFNLSLPWLDSFLEPQTQRIAVEGRLKLRAGDVRTRDLRSIKCGEHGAV
jgi:hypothetical protein